MPIERLADNAPPLRLIVRMSTARCQVFGYRHETKRLWRKIHRLGEVAELTHVVAASSTTDVLRNERAIDTENAGHLAGRLDRVGAHVCLDHAAQVRTIPGHAAGTCPERADSLGHVVSPP